MLRMAKQTTVSNTGIIYLFSFVKIPRKFIYLFFFVSTKLNKYIVFIMQTYKKLTKGIITLQDSQESSNKGDEGIGKHKLTILSEV